MGIARRLAEEIPVICTVHQPSTEIFNQFDWLLLLQTGGEILYFGPREASIEYLKALNVCEYSNEENEAVFVIDAANGCRLKSTKDPSFSGTKLFLQSSQGQEVKAALSAGVAPAEAKETNLDTSRSRNSFPSQVLLLTLRGLTQVWREKADLYVRVFINIFMGFIVGTLWFQQPLDQVRLCFVFGLLA